MAEWLLSILGTPVYWAWCRWRGHGAFPARVQVMTKPGRPDLSFRICWGCGRVYPEDADLALDMLEADLDAEEADA